MSGDQKEEEETLKKIDSIVNFKELYYQERELRIQLQRQLELERIKVKKLTANSKTKARYCAQCSANICSKRNLIKEENQLIDDLKNFSSKLSSMKFSSSLPYDVQPSIISKLQEHDLNRKKHVGMVQNFAVFGINQLEIKNYISEGKQHREFEGQILYSKKQKNDSEMQASKLVFPSGMAIKKYTNIKAKQKTIELMSNCYTNLKSFVLTFQCPDSSFKQHFQHNDLLHHMNPQHRLFCICMGIHDYTYIDKKKDKFNNSLVEINNSQKSIILEQDPQIKSQGHQINMDDMNQSKKSIDDVADNWNQLQIGITQRVFCIMTYFPFFSFFQDILRNLINIVKMDRLVVYKHNQENIKRTIKQTDSIFQKETIVKYFNDIMRDLQYKKVAFNKEYELRLINQQKITQMTYWDQAKSFFVRQWIYSVLSIFTFETFLEVFTLTMLQDKVVFICENSHILTHTIYLFAHVLMKPLNYSFPVVSIIPGDQQDFLNAPFPVVYGMLKKRKSLEQKRILQNFDNTYVFLSPEKVDVYYQEDRKQILSNKSTKLLNNKELKQLFKDLKKTRKKDYKSAKYQLQSSDYCILANADQKQRGVKIVNMISQFINDQIVKKLPSQLQIQNLRKKIDFKNLNEQKDEHTYLMGLVIAEFKKNNKDPFVLQMLSTQMINNFLFTQT